MKSEEFFKRYKIIDKEVSKERKNTYINRTFGELKILDLLYASNYCNNSRNYLFAKCFCNNCKNETYSLLDRIISGDIVSCGCQKIEKAAIAANKKAKIKYIGTIYTTNEGYKIMITDINNLHDVQIEFLNVDKPYITRSTLQNILKGQIKYPFKIIKNGAYYGNGPFVARKNGVKTQEYKIWFGILSRCGRPGAYRDVFISKEWLCFQNFAKWYNDNLYDCELKLSVDKDILSYYELNDNICYSEKRCIIIPLLMNKELTQIKEKTPYEILNIVYFYKKYLPNETILKIEKYFKDHNYEKFKNT